MKQKMRGLQRDEIIFGLKPNTKKTDKTVVHVSLSTLVFKYIYIAHCIFEWVLGAVGKKQLIPNIDGEMCTAKWVFFSSVL